MKKRLIIDRRFRSEIKAHCGRKQDKQRQSRFDELSEIANEAVRERASVGFSIAAVFMRVRSETRALGGRDRRSFALQKFASKSR